MWIDTTDIVYRDGIRLYRTGLAVTHDLADPLRADQLRDVVVSRFERHPADNPQMVARMLPPHASIA